MIQSDSLDLSTGPLRPSPLTSTELAQPSQVASQDTQPVAMEAQPPPQSTGQAMMEGQAPGSNFQSQSSGVAEYSITGDSPLRPGSRSLSLPGSSLGSHGVPSLGPSQGSISGSSISDMVQSQSLSSDSCHASSDVSRSLDMVRADNRSLSHSSVGSSSEGQGLSEPRRTQTDAPGSLESDGSLDLSKSAAALTTLQSVPSQPSLSSSRLVVFIFREIEILDRTINFLRKSTLSWITQYPSDS